MLESLLAGLPVHDDVHTHLAGADHVYVDRCFGQRSKHADRDARVAAQPDAGHRELGHLRSMSDRIAVELSSQLLRDFQGVRKLLGRNGEAEADAAHVSFVALDDHVHEDPGIGDALEHAGGDTRLIGDADDGHQRLALVERQIADEQLLHVDALESLHQIPEIGTIIGRDRRGRRRPGRLVMLGRDLCGFLLQFVDLMHCAGRAARNHDRPARRS